jgi:hypothetical protein
MGFAGKHRRRWQIGFEAAFDLYSGHEGSLCEVPSAIGGKDDQANVPPSMMSGSGPAGPCGPGTPGGPIKVATGNGGVATARSAIA